MTGILNDKPGSSFVATTLPNCNTRTFSRSSTTYIEDIAPIKIRKTAASNITILFIILSPAVVGSREDMEQRRFHRRIHQ